MIQSVSPTSFRNHNANKHQVSRFIKTINWKPWIIVGLIVSVLLIILWLIDWLFVRNERYQMRQIDVVHSGVVIYAQLPDQKIVDQIQWKHYFLTKSRGILSKMQKESPLVSSLNLQSTDTLGLYQLIIRYQPVEMRVRWQGRDYGLVNGSLYPLVLGWSWFILIVPLYFTGMSLSWLFYTVPAQQLAKQYQTIVHGLENKSIQSLTYHVASHQIQVNTLEQEIYFDIEGNIFEQLKKYRTMLSNQKQIANQRVIDLWSISDRVFIYP